VSSTPSPGPTADPFTFSYLETDDLAENQRWSTWDEIGVLAGPEPRPAWVITADAAVDTELGILKTGKEADVFSVERAVPGTEQAVIMAAKRYRSLDHRLFQRDNAYTESRRMRNSRDRRAAAKGTSWGRQVQAAQWAVAEFGFLADLWSVGLPVPYPVQLDGTEILMELITDVDGDVAPRLAQCRPAPAELHRYWEQLVEAMRRLAAMGLTHGDLSAFNILATGERLVIIDLPQAVDVVGNPHGMDFLARDCRNVATWFRSRGLDVDGDELLADLLAYAW
jgi:RIO kinase 1